MPILIETKDGLSADAALVALALPGQKPSTAPSSRVRNLAGGPTMVQRQDEPSAPLSVFCIVKIPK